MGSTQNNCVEPYFFVAIRFFLPANFFRKGQMLKMNVPCAMMWGRAYCRKTHE